MNLRREGWGGGREVGRAGVHEIHTWIYYYLYNRNTVESPKGLHKEKEKNISTYTELNTQYRNRFVPNSIQYIYSRKKEAKTFAPYPISRKICLISARTFMRGWWWPRVGGTPMASKLYGLNVLLRQEPLHGCVCVYV